MPVSNGSKVEVQVCSCCKGKGRFPDGTYSSYDCVDCKGTGKVNIYHMEDGSIRAPLTQFLDRENKNVQAGPKPKSGKILTEIMDGLIRASTDATWLAFESKADREKIKGIELQLWNLRGMLGDYLHAMREEGI